MLTVDDDGVIMTPFLRSSYNYDMSAVSRETGLACKLPTRAQQQFKEEVDINTLVERFGITGQMPVNVRVPLQAEFVDTLDYQTALNKLTEAGDAFMMMPAKIRDEFQNDAGKFVEFVSNPDNIERCREWGLAHAKPVDASPIAVRVVPEAGTS